MPVQPVQPQAIYPPPPILPDPGAPEGAPLIDLGAGAEASRGLLSTGLGPFPDGAPPVAIPIAPAVIQEGAEPQQAERKWKVIPFAGFEVSWTDNLFISATRRTSDFFFTLSPGLAAGWGDYGDEVRQLGDYERHFEPFDLDPDGRPKTFFFGRYNINASFFTENTGQNSVDHDVLLAGRVEAAKLTVGGRLYFQTLSDRDIEVGNRVSRTIYGGEITSKYAVSGKTSLELNVYNRSFDYAKQLDWQEWVVEDWINYEVLPKTKVSLGSRLGLVNVESSPTQTFEQLVGRVSYAPSAKLGFNLDGGIEWRQFGRGGGDEVFGVFSFAGTYAIFDGTQLAIKAYRNNSASIVESDANITATGVSAVIRQRFLQRYFLSIEGGYEVSDYQARFASLLGDRRDETIYFKSRLSFDVTKNLSMEAAYQYRQNDSSRANLSFTENVFILQFKLRF